MHNMEIMLLTVHQHFLSFLNSFFLWSVVFWDFIIFLVKWEIEIIRTAVSLMQQCTQLHPILSLVTSITGLTAGIGIQKWNVDSLLSHKLPGTLKESLGSLTSCIKHDPIYTWVIFLKVSQILIKTSPLPKHQSKETQECAWGTWKKRRKIHIKKQWSILLGFFVVWLVGFFLFCWVILLCFGLVGLFFQTRSQKRTAA